MSTATLFRDRPAAPVEPAVTAVRPVGARFPRIWYVPPNDPPTYRTEPLRIFPTGCRFPRRTLADDRAYRADTATVVPARPLPLPIGARFPRRSAT